MAIRVIVFCLALLTATTAIAQSQSTLEVGIRQGNYYWVVETAADGTRRGGWVAVDVPLNAIDRNTLKPLPPVSSGFETETQAPVAPAPPTVDERLPGIEHTPATTPGTVASAPHSATPVQSTAFRQVTRLQPIQPTRDEDDRALESGSVELMVLGSFSGESVAGGSRTTVDFRTFIGVFATSMLEVGATANVLKSEGLDTAGGLMGNVFFNFQNSSSLVPFVGAGVGTTFGYADAIGHPFVLDLSGGVRFLTKGGGGALVIRPSYQRTNFSGDFGGVGVNRYGVAVGASLLF
jgi:hypothetical protein